MILEDIKIKRSLGYNVFMICPPDKCTASLVLVLVVCLNVWATASTPPKLPLYIGKGYDILVGNPLSGEGVDPGFQH